MTLGSCRKLDNLLIIWLCGIPILLGCLFVYMCCFERHKLNIGLYKTFVILCLLNTFLLYFLCNFFVLYYLLNIPAAYLTSQISLLFI